MKAKCDNSCGVEIIYFECWTLAAPDGKTYRFDTVKCVQEWLMREVGV